MSKKVRKYSATSIPEFLNISKSLKNFFKKYSLVFSEI